MREKRWRLLAWTHKRRKHDSIFLLPLCGSVLMHLQGWKTCCRGRDAVCIDARIHDARRLLLRVWRLNSADTQARQTSLGTSGS